MAIIVDLETLAIDGAGDLVEPVSAPSNYKDEAKIAAFVAEKMAAQIDKAALYPYTARIIALGWCYETDETEQVAVVNCESAEREALREFWARVVDERGSVERLVSFNGRRFDLPLLMVRSQCLGVKHPALNLDRYRSPHLDLLDALTFGGTLDSRTLRWFATRFGLDTSDAFSGKEIADLYADGNWDAIRSHCASDVRLTRQLGERLGLLRPSPRQRAEVA